MFADTTTRRWYGARKSIALRLLVALTRRPPTPLPESGSLLMDTPRSTLLSMKRLLGWVAGVVLLVAAVVLAGRAAERAQIARLYESDKVRVERYAEILGGELSKYNYLPRIVGLNPAVSGLLRDPSDPVRVDAVNRYLGEINREAGSEALYLVDRQGVVIAASNWDLPISFVGIDLTYRPYVTNALKDGVGEFYGIGTSSGEPGYYFARAIDVDGERLGVVVVKVALRRVENPWGPGADPAMVVDEHGVVILTSVPAWRYRTVGPLTPEALQTAQTTRKYADVELQPLGLRVESPIRNGFSVVSLPVAGDGSKRVRYVAQQAELSRSGWEITVLTPATDIDLLTRAIQAVTALTFGSLFLLSLYLTARRRTIRLRLAAKEALERANVDLERKVTERTRDLVDANERLRQEIKERERAEKTTREAQDGLIHAGKLAVIGQMAAGMTHELNQPVAALRTLTDNTALLLERDRPDAVRANLKMMEHIVGRMAKITSQLKVFARRTEGRPEPVPVGLCLDHAIALVETRLGKCGIRLVRNPNEPPLHALCDPGRLEQVFVNLLSNGIDALSGQDGAEIGIEVARVPANGTTDPRVRITFHDNGPGLPENVRARLFEPFFTTKAAGVGLGLGLTISEGIVRQFGGELRAGNRPEGGAEFVVELPFSAAPATSSSLAGGVGFG
jgi:Signal transduction histidine kinase regulating C4-dicarboxylate transport system